MLPLPVPLLLPCPFRGPARSSSNPRCEEEASPGPSVGVGGVIVMVSEAGIGMPEVFLYDLVLATLLLLLVDRGAGMLP